MSKDERSAEYKAIHSFFIGPKGSNMPDFRANINTILDELLEARQSYYPNDQRFISQDVRRSDSFIQVAQNLRLATQAVARLLGEHSAPFWSPRYQAHMCTDLTMSSLLGYFMTMLYNPNNVALEASPMTTLVEMRVGDQLCKMFGYNKDPDGPVGWGHVTCDGTIANLESIWVARNLKFYPLSLFRAVTEGKLQYIANDFKVTPCGKGQQEKLFKDLDTWELLNLRPETVLEMPTTLSNKYGITSQFLQNAVNEYNIQTVGRKVLEEHFKIDKEMQYFVSETRHYSWPKGAAIAGLGSENMVGVEVDYGARINLDVLQEHLEQCAANRQAVYAVVAVMGSTEEGSVDRLSKILQMRQRFQEEHGMSFLVHADAAWAGYFATMLSRNMPGTAPTPIPFAESKPEPESYLDPETKEDLEAMEYADSITVDPHKAGYIPYPAGSLVYRDGRMRHLVTWSGPYLSQGSAENIGVYGVEGSKPGASAMSVWFSNQTVGLHNRGYGTLLGEATFTSARLSAYYATMVNDDFICVPFNMLRSEANGKNSYLESPEVAKEQQKIRDLIIGKEDDEIFRSPEAMEIIRRLGSDTNINAFALNWKYEDGTLNTDLEEANYFMRQIVNRLSITSPDTSPTDIPIFVTSTMFSPKEYGRCMEKFMERIGIDAPAQSTESLFVMRNVVMSPFPSQMNFIDGLMTSLQDVIKDEVQQSRQRNDRARKAKARFIVQGSPDSPEVFLAFQTSFHSANRRQQIIVSAELDQTLLSAYRNLTQGDQHAGIILESNEELNIEKLVDSIGTKQANVTFKASMCAKGAEPEALSDVGTVTLKSVIKSRPLNSTNRDGSYPQTCMPFYLYGTNEAMHMSHMLVRDPNIDLAASNLTFSPPLPQEALQGLQQGLILTMSNFREETMQPFPPKNNDLPESFFFRQGCEFDVKIWRDPNPAEAQGPGLLDDLRDQLYTGKMALGGQVLVDVEGPNEDPFQTVAKVETAWRQKLDDVGEMLDGTYRAAGRHL